MLLDFENAVSSEGEAYSQSNYDGRFDVVRDGYINAKDYETLKLMSANKYTDYNMTLSNENASDRTKKLYRYICKTYGSGILSGQQESTWMGSPDYEMNYLYSTTGKYPAIRGLDFMNDDFNGVVSRAKAWNARGGIVSICWHCSKNLNLGYNESKVIDDSTQTVITENTLSESQWEAILTDGTPEHTAFMNAMDVAGNALLELQEENIPVLWRPFHEFDGKWFWWGYGGSDYFKRLWIMMYNHFTYDLGLNNLIWVLGYSHNGTDYGENLSDWYPGYPYVDIAGADSYEVAQNGAEDRLFQPVKTASNNIKPLVMHETGLIPTVEQFENVKWAYFLTWHTNYLTDVNSSAHLNEIYNSDYVITLDELPEF